MSAALNKSLASGKLSVRKQSSGEAIIVFQNPVVKTDAEGRRYTVTVNPVRIAHANAVDLFARKDVDGDAVRQSNLAELLKAGVLSVL